jgi:hypothetical protein
LGAVSSQSAFVSNWDKPMIHLVKCEWLSDFYFGVGCGHHGKSWATTSPGLEVRTIANVTKDALSVWFELVPQQVLLVGKSF